MRTWPIPEELAGVDAGAYEELVELEVGGGGEDEVVGWAAGV
jgi:hypothetical protein